MTQKARRTVLSAAFLFFAVMGCSGKAPPGLQITLLGNEGFLVEAGGSTVIVDGLYRGLHGYVAPTDEQRGNRERAEPPFDEVDLVLVTHNHPDHFDARVVEGFLNANRHAVFVSTPMAVDHLRDEGDRFRSISERVVAVYPAEGESQHLEIDGIGIEVLNLHHGRDRSLPVENIGFVVEMNGASFLHIGDTLATADELAALELSDRGIDIAFVPYWHLLDSKSAGDYLEVIDATTVVAMHLPAADAPPSYLDPAEDLDGLIRLIREVVPGVLVPTEVMEVTQIRTPE
ncbi:MAG: MBL fold metallo-hydrolase [Acidobacteria bacterium]|uniref:MBL fold metallo-hydrolase n=1 Tax=Candidatus Sulfomarinibacter kjeldsenii TaxID=2885994 RepID=A0A8J6Y6B7_9BACT|nr:MBL fold metallo-hydrolase [Candidatus Sulfomarinibacter kjeldsenii]MBD3871132.1 MBL fold metallo-hydrolase [Candidatus Sulfomarinibacter kjeldsenii]